MLLQGFFKAGPSRRAGERLYAQLVARARAPGLYAALGVPDTPDGRFEIYTLHVVLALERLEAGGPAAGAVAQALFDAYLSGLDHGLRELAVGDLSVGKTMRRLGEAFYGRRRAYAQALAKAPDRNDLESLIGRTVFSASGADPARLADYVLSLRCALAETSLEALLAGDLPESPFPPDR
jgi:cytochrome b pre-mRNA-processing protein 3